MVTKVLVHNIDMSSLIYIHTFYNAGEVISQSLKSTMQITATIEKYRTRTSVELTQKALMVALGAMMVCHYLLILCN